MGEKETVSLIIPVFNKVEFTITCVDSLLSDQDRPNYELIIINNASTDGTSEYLSKLKKTLEGSRDHLLVVTNDKNLGVAPAWNQGAKLATAPYIAVLNNDIKVPSGWMKKLLRAMSAHHLDLVCPFAETLTLDYDLENRAMSFTQKNKNKIWLQEYDFCAFLLPKDIYEKLGPFDENFVVGGYEDTDYCYRFKKEGMRFGVVGASFIHHFGSSTLSEFKKLGDKHVPHNLNYFIKKWGVDPSGDVGSMKSKLKRILRKFKLAFDLM